MRFSTFILLLFFLTACGSKERKQQEQERKQIEKDSVSLDYDSNTANQEIHQLMTKLHLNHGFNGNVLIAKKGKIIYQNVFGWANYLMKDSLKIDSRFELASISKPLTAVGVLTLVESGKISLDQTVDQFFPDFPYPGVTVKQLLTHRSGLPNYIYFVEKHWKDRLKGMSNMEAMHLLAEHKPNRFGSPDGRFEYNNSNYMVLGSIVEKVTGERFSAYMDRAVFKPAGMKNTAVLSKSEHDKIPTNVIGHDKIWRRSVVQNYLDGPVGDKGTYSTVQDLFLFDRALREGRIISSAWQDSSYIGRSDAKRSLFSYGYGWRTFTPKETRMVYHAGWWHGFKGLYVRDLDQDITIVLLTNLANGSLNQLDDLYKILKMPILRQNAYNSSGELIN